MTQPLKHAKFIHAWADGEDVQVFYTSAGEWISICWSHAWCDDNEYRFKPKMIKCGDLEFPEPMNVAPEIGSWVYFPNPLGRCVYVDSHWVGDESEVLLLKRGLVHSTQAAAEQHARALIALTESKS